MLGFYPPVKGEIQIGEYNLGNINTHLWREKCGAVMQEGFIFSDTIAKNIAVSDDVIDKERLLYAVKTANIQDTISFITPLQGLSLGELQTYYYQFVKALKDYQYFIETDFHTKKIHTLSQQKNIQQKIKISVENQRRIALKQLVAQKKLFAIDSNLFVKKVISLIEYEAAKNTLLQAEQTYENAVSAVNNALINISQLEQTILDLQQQANEQEKQLQVAFWGTYENLQSQLNQWEQTYAFRSPLSGKVAMTKFWQRNQNIAVGETLLSIIPEKETTIQGKVMLPAQGAGKVKIGQPVNIKFDGFPYMEYGMVRGIVKTISLVPITNANGKFLVVEIELPNNLMTNYGKEINFSQEMSGIAEIITDDLRLIDRFINPIKSLLKQ
ncbi:hypothetical protein FACS1894201_09840 [Bacteroidia bacterium]|nr:hypothetical protein FACS1894201_09840 [Bacteroidia bacterium]